MNLLIIGGTGILSTAVVNAAVEKGFSISMINRGRNTSMINRKAELLVGDITNTEQIKGLLNGRTFDIVIDFLVWNKEQLERSLSLFSSICKQYVFISSAQVYNTSIDHILCEDSEKVQPLWKYSVHKYEAEEYLKDYCNNHDLKYTIIRPGVNYGDTRIPYGMYPAIGMHWTMIERIKHGKPIITWNKGLNKLNITHVDDFAKGVVGLLGNASAYNESINVVGDGIYTWRDVLEIVGKVCDIKVNLIDIPVDFYADHLTGDARESLLGGRSKNLVCSNERLKELVPSFQSSISLEDGIKRTLDFYRKNNYYRGFDYAYDGTCDRIIIDYCKENRGVDIPNIKFYDYGNEHGRPLLINFLKYQKAYYKNSFLGKLLIR